MKKMYLRIAALLLCAVMLFAACGAKEEEMPASEPQTEAVETVETVEVIETVEAEQEEETVQPEPAEEAEPAQLPQDNAVEEEKELPTDFALGAAPATEGTLVGSLESDKYHYPSCRWVDEILPENETWFEDEADAQAQGYTACATCH